MRVDEQGKAVVGAVLAGLVAGSGAMVTGLAATGGEVTAPVVWGALAALFAAIATTWTGVYFTSNAGTPPPQPSEALACSRTIITEPGMASREG